MKNVGRVLVWIILVSAFLTTAPPAAAQTCRWDGTAPFCGGECGGDETEVTRLGSLPSHWVPPFVNSNPPFGSNCLTGTKALCCKMSGVVCRWDGTAPFCEGACREGETQSPPPPGSSSGSSCWTGSKVYCCRSTGTTGTVRTRLEASADFTRYAAFWDKSPGPPWQARHGLTGAQYQQAFDALAREGYRPVQVTGYGVEGRDTYAGIWERRQGPEWVARHGLTAEQYQQEVDRLSGQGFRPIDVSAFTVAGRDLYATIWERREGPAWVARHNLNGAQFQQEFDRLLREGFRLIDISGYTVGGQDRYAGIWERGEGAAWQARHGLTSAQYQQEFNALAQQGYRLARIAGWRSGDGARYAAIWEKGDGPLWVARHGMLADTYQEEFDRLAKEGYRLRLVSGYHTAE